MAVQAGSGPGWIPDLLEHHALHELADALRARTEAISVEWEKLVERTIPSADQLTFEQIRDDQPKILAMIADALEAASADEARGLLGASLEHGEVRFHQGYVEGDLLIEYRLMRRVVIEQVEDQLQRRLTTIEDLALDMGLDIACHRTMLAFTNQQRTQIMAAAESERLFLSFLSHDVRNSLGSVTLMLKVLRDRLSRTKQFGDEVIELDTLSQLISSTMSGMERLLQGESLRRGAVAVARQPIDLRRLVADVTRQQQRRAEEKGITILVEVPEEMIAHSDPELITLVLQNLLDNAVKFTDRGQVRIRIERRGDTFHLLVIDNGPGVPPELLKVLSQPFHRGETGGRPGMGLGLAIATRAAQMLGAELRIDPPGKEGGATFRLILPA
ncbi:MAG TPA: HAMP domain-containing sensor histidine kinase [Tepidisphaeraceae bacterium]|nr:HAMP domain-containing sensor histidine kinase [Tepidisphaeraceae bacterium]